MHDPAAFAKLVPGFDFLQNLTQSAGAAMPAVGHWIAPTLDPQQLEKRIEELRTVQFWLEQNARMLGATIQALEVQRMTLATLATMNVSLGDLAESLKIRLPETPPAAGTDAAARPTKAPRKAPTPDAGAQSPQVPPGVVDPMKWWGALTQQFTELAAQALEETSGARNAGTAAPAGAPAGEASNAPAATGQPATATRAGSARPRRAAVRGAPR